MPQNSGYSWNNTSSWSQLGQQSGNATTQSSGSYSPQPQSPTTSGLQTNTQHPKQTSNVALNQGNVNTTETRREMITRLYERILGREPDQYGMNYYLFNTTISENQIAKDMYESVEHAEMLDKAKDVRDMVMRMDQRMQEIRDQKIRLQNLETLAENYKALLDEKTQQIQEMTSSQSSSTTQSQRSPQDTQYLYQSQESNANQSVNYDELPEDPFKDVHEPGLFSRIKRVFKRN